MNRLFLISGLCIALTACNNNSKNVTIVYDTIEAPDTMNFHIVDNPEITYSGILPCADCSGILTELLLDTDSLTYKLTETYQGEETADSIFVTTGKYVNNFSEPDKKIVQLLNSEQPEKVKYLKVTGDSGLVMLDKLRKEISGNKNYFLAKK